MLGLKGQVLPVLLLAGLVGFLGGCGDGGTGDYVPGASTVGRVTYDYSAILDSQVASLASSVRYVPLDAEGQWLGELSPNYDLESSLTLERVPKEAVEIQALYYNHGQQLVGMGIDSLSWISTPKLAAQVQEPQYLSFEGASLEVEPSQTVLAPGEEIQLQAWVTFLASGERVDFTKLVDWQGGNEQILSPVGSSATYRGAEMGIVEDLEASIPCHWGPLSSKSPAIYVTRQTLTGLVLERAPVDGHEATHWKLSDVEIPPELSLLKQEGFSTIVGQFLGFSDDWNYNVAPAGCFGLAGSSFTVYDYETGTEREAYIPFYRQPIQAKIGYSQEEGLGPQPPAQELTPEALASGKLEYQIQNIVHESFLPVEASMQGNDLVAHIDWEASSSAFRGNGGFVSLGATFTLGDQKLQTSVPLFFEVTLGISTIYWSQDPEDLLILDYVPMTPTPSAVVQKELYLLPLLTVFGSLYEAEVVPFTAAQLAERLGTPPSVKFVPYEHEHQLPAGITCEPSDIPGKYLLNCQVEEPVSETLDFDFALDLIAPEYKERDIPNMIPSLLGLNALK